MNKTFKKGFTLVELLIVMVILGILTTIVAASFRSSQEKARDTRRKSDLAAVADAVELYFNDTGEYPQDDGSGNIDGFTWGEEFVDANGTVYMIKLPQEKTSAKSYYYYSEPTNGTYTKYALFTRLENDQDKDIPTNPTDPEIFQYYANTNCGGGTTCNYAISSTNTNPEDLGSPASFTLTDEP